jgi:hypothetical protein
MVVGVVACVVVFSAQAVASCKVDVSRYVGWQVIYSGTVTGYINEDGKEEDSFESCEHGRVLIVDYTNVVTCAEYSYSYAYHPDIVILSKGSTMKACIDNEMYDVRQ